jgi:5-bromo-4-chloroindolyl phosphate hydrolysis protein
MKTKKTLTSQASKQLLDVEKAVKELQHAREEIQRLNKLREDALQSVKRAQQDYELTASTAQQTKAKAEQGLETMKNYR